MKKLLRDANIWYGKKKESTRFFIMLGLALPGIIATQFTMLSMIYLILLIIVRWAYLSGHLDG